MPRRLERLDPSGRPPYRSPDLFDAGHFVQRVYLYLTCDACDSMWNWDGESLPPELTCPFSRDCGKKGTVRVDEKVGETPELATYRATLV